MRVEKIEMGNNYSKRGVHIPDLSLPRAPPEVNLLHAEPLLREETFEALPPPELVSEELAKRSLHGTK